MKKNLTIDTATLPEEGKLFSGELDGSIFDLPDEDAKADGSLEYEIHAQKFDSELLIRGSLSVPMEFTCVRTLQRFVQTITAESFDISIELEGSQVDLADHLREELAILFPDYPRCDEADEPMDCEVDSRYLAVDKPTDDDVKTPPRDATPTPWDALDAIEDTPDAGKS
ncbi:MAG: DUF177 domain-containing protein [Akkermansiaceae bacterium]